MRSFWSSRGCRCCIENLLATDLVARSSREVVDCSRIVVDRKARVARQVSAVAVSREKVGGLLGVADSRTAFSQTAANRRTTAEDQSPSDRTFDADCSATGRRSVRDLVPDYITCVADFIPTPIVRRWMINVRRFGTNLHSTAASHQLSHDVHLLVADLCTSFAQHVFTNLVFSAQSRTMVSHLSNDQSYDNRRPIMCVTTRANKSSAIIGGRR